MSAALGGLFGLAGSLATAAFNAKQAKKNRKFQKKVLQKRYQWQVADLRAAGINPMLAPNLGAGSAPGAQATAPDFGQAMMAGAERGSKLKLPQAQKVLLEAQVRNQASATDLNRQKTLGELQSQKVQRYAHPVAFAKELISDDIPDNVSGTTNATLDAMKGWLRKFEDFQPGHAANLRHMNMYPDKKSLLENNGVPKNARK